MVADPKDPQCCQVPECTPTPGPNGYPTPVPGVSPMPSVVTNVPGFVTGVAPTPTPGPDGKTPAPTRKSQDSRSQGNSLSLNTGCNLNGQH